MQAHKVNASRGAQWLLDSFGLLRQYPAQLASMGFACGVVSTLPFVSLVTVILFGGLLVAVRCADEGRVPGAGLLFSMFASIKGMRLLVIAGITIVVSLTFLVLLFWMVGSDVFVKILDVARAGNQPDVDLFADTPVDGLATRAAVVLLLVFEIGLCLAFFMFFYIPLVTYSGATVVDAWRLSIRAGVKNAAPIAVLLLILMVISICVALGSWMISTLILFAIAPGWIPVVFSALFNGVMTLIIAGVLYFAWKDVFGPRAAKVASTLMGHLEV